MNSYQQIAQSLIKQSVAQNEIVSVEFEHELSEELFVQADDSTTDFGRCVREFWGETKSGDSWRVHLLNVPSRLAIG